MDRPAKNYRVWLIVDDSDHDRFFLERSLRKAGATGPIIQATSATDAIHYLKGENQYSDRMQFPLCNMILTDLKMPNGDGLELLLYVQRNPQLGLPVIVLTGSNDPDDVKRSYMLGASSYMTKSASLDEKIRLFHDYWMSCELPSTDALGQHLPTDSKGKLGQRFE